MIRAYFALVGVAVLEVCTVRHDSTLPALVAAQSAHAAATERRSQAEAALAAAEQSMQQARAREDEARERAQQPIAALSSIKATQAHLLTLEAAEAAQKRSERAQATLDTARAALQAALTAERASGSVLDVIVFTVSEEDVQERVPGNAGMLILPASVRRSADHDASGKTATWHTLEECPYE